MVDPVATPTVLIVMCIASVIGSGIGLVGLLFTVGMTINSNNKYNIGKYTIEVSRNLNAEMYMGLLKWIHFNHNCPQKIVYKFEDSCGTTEKKTSYTYSLPKAGEKTKITFNGKSYGLLVLGTSEHIAGFAIGSSNEKQLKDFLNVFKCRIFLSIKLLEIFSTPINANDRQEDTVKHIVTDFTTEDFDNIIKMIHEPSFQKVFNGNTLKNNYKAYKNTVNTPLYGGFFNTFTANLA